MSAPFGRLLIVDDEKPVLDVLSEYFGSQGHAVETAESGGDAIAVLERARPDLVLLDVRMPGMDGVEVLKRLRAIAPTLPVIMVTANEDVALARLTLKLGAFDYVSKPFDFSYLDRAVTAGLVHASEAAEAAPAAPPAGPGDPLHALLVATFRLARAMPAMARVSTGARLEDTMLAAVLEPAGASGRLDALALLLDLAVELGDLTPVQRESLGSAIAAARRAVVPPVP